MSTPSEHEAPDVGSPVVAATAPPPRILGIDVARALAVIGMVAVHIGPVRITDPTVAQQLYALPHGRASVLFVLLAGLGVTLLAGDRAPARLRGMWARVVWRAVVLLPIGLGLQLLDHGVLVILQYYAVYYLLAGVAVHLSSRLLVAGALAGTVLGPVLWLAAHIARPAAFDTGRTEWGDPLLLVARQLLVTGSYPALIWAAPLLLGVWLGRRDLRAARVRWWMAGGGAGAAIGAAVATSLLVGALGEPVSEPSWLQLAGDDPHSDTPLWLIGAMGSATAVLGGSLLLTDRLPRLTWPLAATGQLAFTIYVAHLLVLDRATDVLRRAEVAPAALSLLRFTVVAVALSALWRCRFRRGPLEALLHLPWAQRRRPR